jgi:hypothetical protein
MTLRIPPLRTPLLSFLLLLPAFVASAQSRHTISGYIKDGKSGEQLIGATVRIKELPAEGTATNAYGFYSITIQDGSYTVIANSVGFAEQSQPVTLNKDLKLDIVLNAQGRELNEVVVSTRAKDEQLRSAQMGVTNLNMEQVNQLPVLFGERDVLKAVQLLPGVKSAGEGNSGFFVRGGAADQNLINLDEALVYNPSHLFGFFSTFNSDAIKDVTLYKGNMPSQYGGRLSSVTDVTMKDGSNKEYHATGGIGLIASRLSVEGPITKDKGSFLVSGRRTYADMFLKLSNDTQLNRNKLYFYDLNLKANYRLGEKDRIFISGYFGQDKLGLADLFGFTWGNSTATGRWNHQFSPKVFSNTSLIYNDYRYDVNLTTSGFNASIKSRIRDITLKEEISFFPNSRNTWRIGLNETFHRILPGTYSGDFTLDSQPESRSLEHAIYINNSWKPSDRFSMEYGVRVSGLSVIAGDNKFYELNENGTIRDTLNYAKGSIVQTYVIPEPRASASYRLNEVSSMKGAYSRNAQYLHLVSNSASSNPTDKWIATNNIIKPEIADQVSLGYFRNLKNNRYEFSVEGYYKYMQNQIDYRDGANVLSNDAVEPQMLFGVGRAYGLEFLLRKTEGRFTGWIGYTLSRTERKIEGINNGAWYVARQDRTHDISIVGIYQLTKKWTVSGTFVYYTGNAVSFPSGKYRVGNQIAYYYTERNGYRMPDYHRLDLSATCKLSERKRFSSELALGVYNAYGRENAYVITFEDDPNDPNRTRAVQTALFRFVPSVTYNFKF